MVDRLRFFVFGASDDGWSDVWVTASAEELRTRCEEVLARQPTPGVMVHAGCVRPRLEAVDAVARVFAGRVLLSESARWALPVGGSVHPEPVAACAYLEGQRDLPIYLATDGWGYSLSEKDWEKLPRPKGATSAAVATGWLAAARNRSPEVALLTQSGVCDDASYANWRLSADPETRRITDELRFETLSSALSEYQREDPSLVVPLLPPEILDAAVDVLAAPTRLRSFFRAQQIEKIGDLQSWSRDRLLDSKNLGRKSLRDMARALAGAARHQLALHRTSADTPVAPVVPDSLVARLETGLRSKTPRAERIVRARVGYGAEFMTLEELGNAIGITRERVRQLEARALAQLEADAFPDDAFRKQLQRLLDAGHGPVFLDLLTQTDEWFRGIEEDALARLIEAFGQEEYHVIREDGRRLLARLNQAAWESLKTSIVEYLKLNLGMPLRDVELHIRASAYGARAQELYSILFEGLRPYCHFATPRGESEQRLVAVGSEGRHVVTRILLEADRPLHLDEIATAATELRQEPIARPAVARWLVEIDAKLFGRGTYGLEAHIPSVVRQDEVVQFMADLISGDESERQWHAWDILEALVASRPELCVGVDPYIINILMQRLPDETFEYQGRFVWTFRRKGMDEAQRIDIADAFTAALINAGRPLSASELYDAVSKLRGLRPNGGILPSDRMIRIAPGIWGLRDRDVVLSDREIAMVLNGLEQVLQGRGCELHLSEVRQALAGSCELDVVDGRVSDYVIFSLAQTDERFHLHVGQLLGLRSWGRARRPSLAAAVRGVAAEIVSETGFDEIWSRVCASAQRVIPKAQLSSALQASNLRWDEVSGMWSPASVTEGGITDALEESFVLPRCGNA